MTNQPSATTAFEKLYDFWFAPLLNQEKTLKEMTALWFSQNKDFDRECYKLYSHIAQSVKWQNSLNTTQKAIVGRIIFLDQLPRNSFRGEKRSLCLR